LEKNSTLPESLLNSIPIMSVKEPQKAIRSRNLKRIHFKDNFLDFLAGRSLTKLLILPLKQRLDKIIKGSWDARIG